MTIRAACIAALVLAQAAHAQCTGWDERFFVAGCTGSVADQVIFDDGSGPALVYLGSFLAAGEVATRDIAKFDGEHWSKFGDGLEVASQFSYASCIAAYDDGSGSRLYIGGSFDTVNGVSAHSLARWNGSAWEALPIELPQGARVWDMVEWDDGTGPALFVAGSFASIGALAVNNIAKWNGTVWTDLAGGATGGQTTVQTLAIYDDGGGPALYAAGGFTSAGSTPASRIAKWNGSAWSALGGGLDAFTLSLGAYDAGAGSELYVSGFFTHAGGVPAASLAKWDGVQWSALGSGLAFNTYVDTFAVYDNGNGPRLYAGGNFMTIGGVSAKRIARYDGVNWSALPGEPDDTVHNMIVFDDGTGHGERLFAAGDFRSLGGLSLPGTAIWDGAQWSPVGPQGQGIPYFASSFGSEIFKFDDGSGPAILACVAPAGAGCQLRKWSGNAWSTWAHPDGLVDAYALHDDGSGAGAQLYIGGWFSGLDGVGAKCVARWTGTAWAPLGSGFSGGTQRVRDLLSFDDGSGPALYACGSFNTAGGQTARRIARWDGANWSEVGGGVSGTSTDGAQAMAVYDDGTGPHLYVAGGFTTAGSTTVNRIARWNGATWDALGTGLGGSAFELAVFDDGTGSQLYVGGAFALAGGAPAQLIARWNGVAWSPVGTGLQALGSPYQVTGIVPFDDGTGPALYVSGWFGSAGSQPLHNLARWQGNAWSDVAGGFVGIPMAMAALDDPLGLGPSLYFDGTATAGDVSSAGFARYGLKFPCVASYCTAGTSSHGCAPTMSASGFPSASSASSFVVTASGVDAQKTGLIFYGLSGPTSAPWGSNASTLCVKAPQQRTAQANSGGTLGSCDGSFVLDWNSYVSSHPNALGAPFHVGESLWLQGWYRDPPSSKTTALTNALETVVGP